MSSTGEKESKTVPGQIDVEVLLNDVPIMRDGGIIYEGFCIWIEDIPFLPPIGEAIDFWIKGERIVQVKIKEVNCVVNHVDGRIRHFTQLYCELLDVQIDPDPTHSGYDYEKMLAHLAKIGFEYNDDF